ncbi:hypothetical protein HELRODRAFT_111140 [Helobdella robusta]|uniref:Glucose-6-phosphate 1-dehydrogenase n=1 Tax=Helobdella robusta TaxID=6412 RepID=T1EF87_HELRO|nr:hypothetical protein HELRODRAFT_111140 [Helobdella robusta]ESO05721.1 hypothetical protein HELRODRAFT_111140 [Helobdella robusta]
MDKCEDVACHKAKKGFSETVQYVQLKSSKHFKELAMKINENTQSLYGLVGSPNTYEVGRLFYLAIPPSAYAETAERIHKYLLPEHGRGWVKIVVEKPFGRDLNSAKLLNSGLLKRFDESQIYRVDHYLGKTVVKMILPFRVINSNSYSQLWNADYIDRVEIVMKEELDVVGRTQFYNENGVVRDVMQNHLTELFMLTAMQLPSSGGVNISEIHELKYDLLKKVKLPKMDKILLGQYSTYNVEWLAENKETNKITDTPTFAATTFYVDSEMWRGVPFLFMSGKKLNEKTSYVRIVLKNRKFCLNHNAEFCKDDKQIVFYIGGKFGEFIAVSKDLPLPSFRSGWKKKTSTAFKDVFGQSTDEMHLFFPVEEVESYTELIKSIIKGARHMFVPSSILYQSWQVWSSLLEVSDSTRPRIYIGKDKDPERLDFYFDTLTDGLKFVIKEPSPNQTTST